MDSQRILLPGMTAAEWDKQRSSMGAVEMFPADEWNKFLKGTQMTISESIIASAKEGDSASQTVSDLERAARAICVRLGHDPDRLGYNYVVEHVTPTVWLMPKYEAQPLWHFFTREAEAALSVLDL